MTSVFQDLRFALRQFARYPGFTVVAAVTLALGIGASTAVFSVVNGVLLRPLPYADEESVVKVWNTYEEGTLGLSENELLEYRELDVFSNVAAYTFGSLNLTGEGDAERVPAVFGNASLLRVLGVAPISGRHIAPEEDTESAELVVLLSRGLWERRYASDPGIVGSAILLNARPRTVIGILPDGFRVPGGFGGAPPAILAPLALTREPDPRNLHYLHAVARLNTGVTPAQASAALAPAASRLKERLGTLPETFSAKVVPVRDEIVGDVRPALLILLSAVALVLLIACVNVANLLLARGDARQREMAVRVSLGAGRSRLLRQLGTEAFVLASLGGIAGLLIGLLGSRALIAMSPPGLPRLEGIGVDARVLAFSLMATVGTAVLVGLLPALRASREDAGDALRGARGSTSGRSQMRTRRGLVTLQVALATMLAIGAGLLARSFIELRAVDPGFQPGQVLTLQLSLPSAKYEDAPAARRFYEELFGRIESIPGVEEVGATRALPLTGNVGDWGVRIRGRGPDGLGERGPAPDWIVATDGYFEAMRIPLVAGRFFEQRDRDASQQVVVISDGMAKRHWPDGNALGGQLRMTTNIDTLWRTVVGIVGDVHQVALNTEPREAMYLPHAQFPSTTGDLVIRQLSLTVRASGEPARLAGAVREEVRAIDADVPISGLQTMVEVTRAATAPERFQGLVFGLFALIALLLVVVGVYGVTAYLVARRARELGVRMALGATPDQVRRLVLGEGLTMTALGLAGGVMAAWALARSLSGLLFGISVRDPFTFAFVPLFISVVALLSALIPAARASRVDPLATLRED
jgi:putative ABC transport system permease protein